MPHIIETIITSKDGENAPYAAPFGVERLDGKTLEFAPFYPSKTLENLSRHPRGIVHYTDDPMSFVGCLIGRRQNFSYSPLGEYGFILSGCCGWSLIEVVKKSADKTRPRLTCRVLKEMPTAGAFGGFNRAFGGIIEACVAISRRHILAATEVEKVLANAKVLVEKTADDRHKLAFSLLEQFYAKNNGTNQTEAGEA